DRIKQEKSKYEVVIAVFRIVNKTHHDKGKE
ncbi:MAG: hypothetical protein RLZZ197_643, partial [Bacteroidota bacterium]